MTLTRRAMLQVSGGTFAGYAVAADPVLGQAIKTDTTGIAAGEFEVKVGDYGMPVYEARPASGSGHPIILVISEIWGVHEYIRDSTRRFAKEGYYAIAPELFKREGGVAHLPNIQDILKIVLSQPRPQTLGDLKAAVDWAKRRPGVQADRVGVTGWCWGGSTTIQVAATNPDMKAAVAWYGPPGRPYPSPSGPLTGFDVAKDIKIPLLLLFGEKDTNPPPGDGQKLIELIKPTNPNVELVVYPEAGHGFHADYRPSYNAKAATEAWRRCTTWFNRYLKA
ncbi:MAG: dienelactone hydrolase family protein [Candidatus Rokuibacteriota bacterium]